MDIQIIFFKTIYKFANLLVIFFFAFLIYGCAESNPPTVEALGSTEVSGSITTDTIWDIAHSPYIAKSDIIVERSATLILHPGVEVRFDGFYGFIVKGVLIANGMTEIQQPETNQGVASLDIRLETLDDYIITFTSTNTDPEIKDWKGIEFQNTNDDKSFLRYVKVEYAETGVNIFSSSPKIMDCFIMNNYRGIQSYGSKPTIMNNLIKDNTIGIIMKGRGRTVISKNVITQNEIGLILYMEGVEVKQNNLADNFDYAIRVAYKAQRKISALDNWWGSTVVDDIERQIYDNLDDAKLARVSFAPFAKFPFTDAGPDSLLPSN